MGGGGGDEGGKRPSARAGTALEGCDCYGGVRRTQGALFARAVRRQ